MTAARAKFTQADIKRAVDGVKKLGQSVAAIDFPPEGGFRLILGDRIQVDTGKAAGNEWDVVLTP